MYETSIMYGKSAKSRTFHKGVGIGEFFLMYGRFMYGTEKCAYISIISIS